LEAEQTTSNKPELSAGPRGAAVAVVVSAACAMAATLPGRTYGISLITARLLDDFAGLTETRFATINLVAALVGGACCLPAGWLLDRFGARRVLAFVMLALALSVWLMARSQSVPQLAVTLTLTRVFGQSMLSVLSIAMLSKWFARNAGLAMGTYAVLMTMLLATAVSVLEQIVAQSGWRSAWSGAAVTILALTPGVCLLALRPRTTQREQPEDEAPAPVVGVSFVEAIRTRCFWLFALASALLNLTSSGVTLFLVLIFEARGLPESVYYNAVIISLFAGLFANLLGGWLAKRWSMSWLMAVCMALLSAALLALVFIRSPWQAYLQAAVSGLAGGGVTVLFFSVWVHAFGPARVGRIQGAAQLLCVIGSAVGPVLVAQGRAAADSYAPVLVVLSAVALGLGVLALWTRVPAAGQPGESAT
jgi:MFS family permease